MLQQLEVDGILSGKEIWDYDWDEFQKSVLSYVPIYSDRYLTTFRWKVLPSYLVRWREGGTADS